MDLIQYSSKNYTDEEEILAHLRRVFPEWHRLAVGEPEGVHEHTDRKLYDPVTKSLAVCIEMKQRDETWETLKGFTGIVLQRTKQDEMRASQVAGVPWHFVIRTKDNRVMMFTLREGDLNLPFDGGLPITAFTRNKPRANGEHVNTDRASLVFNIPPDRFEDITQVPRN